MTEPPAGAALSIDLVSEAATSALAARLARASRAGDVIALRGELGSGKTSLARAFIRTLGRGDEEVPSPTFTLVEVYGVGEGLPAIWHFDLFRLQKPEEVHELGFEEALAGGISLIEWPERLGALLPREHLDLTLLAGSDPARRTARLVPSPVWLSRLEGIIGS